MKKYFCSILAVLILPFFLAAQNLSPDVKEIVKQMTLEEKVKMVVGLGMKFPGLPENNTPAVGQTLDKVPGAAGTTFAIPRLNIPNTVLADGPAGLRINPVRNGDSSKTYYATAFPISTLLASTWDTALVRQVGNAIGNEVLEYGVDIILMPALNIHRNPLCGRNFEYYSEDPVIAGHITAAMVNGIQSNGVGVSLKHFAANNQETNRNAVNVVISERALREIYLRGFEIANKLSNPWTFMSSYNKINGTYTSESYDLLTKKLRNDWGFRGYVMTDWFGGKDPVAQMNAGNDLLMPGYSQQTDKILEALKNGLLDEKILDLNIERILNITVRTPAYKNYKYSNNPDLKKHAEISRNAATEGMVLLKNEKNTLPVSVSKIALFGNAAYNTIIGGTGSGDVNEAYIISLDSGLINSHFILNKELGNTYRKYYAEEKAKQPKPKNAFMPRTPIAEMPVDASLVDNLADEMDVAVITLGRDSGEFTDRKLENDFYLSEAERNLIANVSEVFHKKNKRVIVVLNIGGVIETACWRDNVDAILIAWQPGQEAGNAIADVLTGKVNPSGKLATTFPLKYEDVPSSNNFPGLPLEKPDSVVYAEDIFVGYRHFNTFNVKPAYEFGYGLSYTKFEFSKPEINTEIFKERIIVKVKVKNVGKTAGKEVAGLYLSAPAEKLKKPVSELKGFAKTKLLQPGESQTLMFALNAKDLCSFDMEKGAWVAEQGSYKINIGASSLDIKGITAFTLANELIVEQVSK